MKIFLSFLLCSIFYTVGISQDIPAKTNTIIITMPDSTNLHQKIIKILSDKGYSVRNAEKPSTAFTTEAKTLKNSRVSLHIDRKGTEIVLTGTIIIAGQDNMKIENKGAKGTPILTAFEEMEKVAKAFGGKLKHETR